MDGESLGQEHCQYFIIIIFCFPLIIGLAFIPNQGQINELVVAQMVCQYQQRCVGGTCY